MIDLWAVCEKDVHIAPLAGELMRIVESQQQVVTLSLVDDLAEQAVLEGLLERAKPPLPPGTERLHYLLAAPFRYPPLRHGSRFGRRFEPSLFYGSRRLTTLLAEAAYYRFVFFTGMEISPPSGRLLTQHSVFRARFRAERGVRLQQPLAPSTRRCYAIRPITRQPSASAARSGMPLSMSWNSSPRAMPSVASMSHCSGPPRWSAASPWGSAAGFARPLPSR